MDPVVCVLGGAASLGLLFTWLARGLARQSSLMDHSDGRRKLQDRPVARVGGLALFASTILAVAGAAALSDEVRDAVAADLGVAVALFAAAAIIACVGLADDIFALRARHKFAGQLFAIAVLIFGGDCLIENVSLFGATLPLGIFAVPVTALWFLTAVNGLNLLDGMDGLLGCVGAMMAATIGAMAFAHGHPFEGFAALALAGGLLGFLRFNLPPATVYLGDCGSMLVGLVIAALATHAALKGPTVAIASPLVLLILPIVDTTAAVVRRKLTGRSIAIPDRGHLHHMLQKRGLSPSRALILVSALCGIASLGAFASSVLHSDWAALAAALCIGLILVSGGFFGTAELKLIRERVRNLVSTLRGQKAPVEMEVRLQGSADWGEVWLGIAAQAESLNLISVRLDVNAPAWHEGYHRRWTRKGIEGDALVLWSVDLPLFGHGQVIGRLSVSGARGEDCIAAKLAALSNVVERAEALASEITLPAHLASRKHPAAALREPPEPTHSPQPVQLV